MGWSFVLNFKKNQNSVKTVVMMPRNTFSRFCYASTSCFQYLKLNFLFCPFIRELLFLFPEVRFLPVIFCLVCENGWRCCLINRDRKMPTDYIRNGILYVTEKWVIKIDVFLRRKMQQTLKNRIWKWSFDNILKQHSSYNWIWSAFSWCFKTSKHDRRARSKSGV